MVSVGEIVVNEKVREYIGQLVTNVYLSNEVPAPDVLAVVSAEEGEGKSEIGLAIGLELKNTFGENVIIVEGNVRRPGIANIVGIENVNGFIELVSGNVSFEEAIKSLGEDKPDIIVAGEADKIEEGKGKLLNKNTIKKIIDELKERYKYIIIEAPAINRYPEGQIISSISDGVIVVVGAGKTSRESVALGVKKLEAIGGKVIGLVLNKKEFYLPNWLYKRL